MQTYSGEEGGGGKITLLERGGYNGMHACLMSVKAYGTRKSLTVVRRCHPSAGSPNSSSTGSCLALQPIDVEFFGHS